jgi:hypothetical protein
MKIVNNLRKTLFWDVDFNKLDNEKNSNFIIGRVLDFGNLEEWKEIKNFYGIRKIKEVVEGHRFSNKRNLCFWTTLLKCTNKQSLQKQNAFWNL